ncbi:MAG: hypothetical protein L0216_08185, partial [Planctomycetales bacterium]|nr:hypothetical protein [Planctomycetales bacterium]
TARAGMVTPWTARPCTRGAAAGRSRFWIRLARALGKHGRLGATELVGEILGEIQRHVRDEEPHDDLTLVALKRE